MTDALNDAIGSLVVFLASIWAFFVCRDLLFASAGFVLYAVVGILGVLDYGFSNNKNIKKLLNHVSRWSRPLYFPLVGVDALLIAGLDLPLSLALLIFPLFYLIMTELLHKQVRGDIMDLSTIVCALAICYSAYLAQDVVGGVLALLGLAAFMGNGSKFRNSLEHLLLVAVVDLAAVQFFNHPFSY